MHGQFAEYGSSSATVVRTGAATRQNTIAHGNALGARGNIVVFHSHAPAQPPRRAHAHPKKTAVTLAASLHTRMPHRALHACAHSPGRCPFPGRCPGLSHPAPLGQNPPRYRAHLTPPIPAHTPQLRTALYCTTLHRICRIHRLRKTQCRRVNGRVKRDRRSASQGCRAGSWGRCCCDWRSGRSTGSRCPNCRRD